MANVLAIRIPAGKTENNGEAKKDFDYAMLNKVLTGYALSYEQRELVKAGAAVIIVDQVAERGAIGIIAGMEEHVSETDSRKGRFDIKLALVAEGKYVDIHYAKGWDAHKGVTIVDIDAL